VSSQEVRECQSGAGSGIGVYSIWALGSLGSRVENPIRTVPGRK